MKSVDFEPVVPVRGAALRAVQGRSLGAKTRCAIAGAAGRVA